MIYVSQNVAGDVLVVYGSSPPHMPVLSLRCLSPTSLLPQTWFSLNDDVLNFAFFVPDPSPAITFGLQSFLSSSFYRHSLQPFHLCPKELFGQCLSPRSFSVPSIAVCIGMMLPYCPLTRQLSYGFRVSRLSNSYLPHFCLLPRAKSYKLGPGLCNLPSCCLGVSLTSCFLAATLLQGNFSATPLTTPRISCFVSVGAYLQP